MSNEHVEVLREMKGWRMPPIGGSAYNAALDAAIAALSAPQPPAEAQPVYVGVDLEGGWIRATAPPSAPVGVEAVLAKLREALGADGTVYQQAEGMILTLAQQPASDGGFTAADMMDARQEGRKEAQQPAAVDDAMVERATMALLGKTHDSAPGVDWRCDRSWTVNRVRELMRLALSAALAGQQGGMPE